MMTSYLELVNALHSQFESCEVYKVPRESNSHANALANPRSSTNSTMRRVIPVGYLKKPCINWLTSELALDDSQPSDDQVCDLLVDHCSSNNLVSDPLVDHYSSNDSPTSWMIQILMYIEHRELPFDKKQARKLHIQSARYFIIGRKHYRHSFSGSYLQCLDPQQALYIIREIYEGDCGNHPSPRSFFHKAI